MNRKSNILHHHHYLFNGLMSIQKFSTKYDNFYKILKVNLIMSNKSVHVMMINAL